MEERCILICTTTITFVLSHQKIPTIRGGKTCGSMWDPPDDPRGIIVARSKGPLMHLVIFSRSQGTSLRSSYGGSMKLHTAHLHMGASRVRRWLQRTGQEYL